MSPPLGLCYVQPIKWALCIKWINFVFSEPPCALHLLALELPLIVQIGDWVDAIAYLLDIYCFQMVWNFFSFVATGISLPRDCYAIPCSDFGKSFSGHLLNFEIQALRFNSTAFQVCWKPKENLLDKIAKDNTTQYLFISPHYI